MDACELGAGAAACPSDGALRDNKVLQCGSVINQTSELGAVLSTDRGVIASRQNFTIGLQRDCIDNAVRARVQGIISLAARGMEPGNAISRLPSDVDKIAAHQNPAVGLQPDRKDDTVRTR